MNYIRKAGELGDGWTICDGKYESLSALMAETVDGYRFYLADHILLDYLAAQLVRQVDALGDDAAFVSLRDKVVVTNYLSVNGQADERGDDRTMNTIKAIVDSKVLGR